MNPTEVTSVLPKDATYIHDHLSIHGPDKARVSMMK